MFRNGSKGCRTQLGKFLKTTHQGPWKIDRVCIVEVDDSCVARKSRSRINTLDIAFRVSEMK